MIDENKLIEDIESLRVTVNGLRAGKGILREFEKHYKESILRIIEEQPKVGDWIPADKPPKDDNFVLLSFENFSLPMVGRYESDGEGGGAYYLGDCDEEDTCVANDLFVNAWQPLPEAYNPEIVQKQTNADRIRAMSDEELAELLYSLQYCDEKLNFCGNNKECDDILDGGGTISDEMCKQCFVWWLQREVEE